MEGLEEKMDDYSSTLDAITTLHHNTNPYEKYTIKDWRDGRPEVKHRHDKSLWLTQVSDRYEEEFREMNKIIHDVRLCMFVFPEWEERFLHIGYLVDRTGVYDTSELIRLERINYEKSKKKWEEEDAEFIAERKIYKSHQDHRNREQFQKDEYYRFHFGNQDPDYWTTCKWCIKYEKEQQECKEALIEQDRILEEANRKYCERMREQEAERIANIQYETCGICDYRTSNMDAFERHLESKEHRVKQNHIDWFCESCNTQSRSKNEHEFHLKSTKHQARAGLVAVDVKEPTAYTCDCCDYETHRKDVYNRHLTSKKHITNSSN
jgi:hypothetical protein